MDLEHIGNIPVSTSAIASLFTNIEAGNQKVRSLEAAHKIIRLKKGLYLVAPNVSRVALSTELIANHLYAPSYVSMQTALRYYGLIPEAVYTTQSMTLKHSRSFDTPVGRFEYKNMSREAFSIGITSINMQSYAFLMATPEKALCDLIANSPKVNLRYQKDVENYLEEDIRMEIDDFRNMDIIYPRDKHNHEYGWGWSLLNTPEDLYGKEACQCNRTPEESYQRIFEHLKEILPDASDKQIIKLIG